MFVIKRTGEQEPVAFDRITDRIENLAKGLSSVDVRDVAQRVIAGVHSGMHTSAIDELTCEVLAAMIASHPEYGVLASRVAVSNLHKRTSPSFSETELALLDDEVIASIIRDHASKLDSVIRHDNDFNIPYFGLKTLESNYLLRDVENGMWERPQYAFMRTALEIHREDIESVVETYELISNMKGIHATPTLMNACCSVRQLASCYLVTPGVNTVDELFDKLKKCASISDRSGGIGINLSHIRLHDSSVIGVMRLFNEVVRVVSHQGKRRSAIAVYLEPWHADIFAFLKAKLANGGSEDTKCRDLFQGLWIPDLFMKRVQRGENWTLFDPAKCPGLSEVWGTEFEELYERYEREGRGRTVSATALWKTILRSQTETGGPYMLYKDACNAKSNQRHLGTIKCSNLCSEIIEYTSGDEIAVCNLASVSLPACVSEDGESFDLKELARVTKILTRNLNKIIDRMVYPVSEAQTSNEAHRPIGIGVQGLADVFAKMDLAFDSPEARDLNRTIAETMYFSALDASCELAEQDGPYASYEGSPASKGLLQHDLWKDCPDTDRHDWKTLRARIAKYGLRNSLLIALMPTASTATILGNNESFEPFTNNVFTRRVSCGNFQVVNKHLVKRLIDMGMWNEETKNRIIEDDGSVKNLAIPEEMKRVFRTVWEIPQRSLIDMAADRGPYVDQSQSMSLFLPNPNNSNMSSMHLHAWKKGLKTGIYYLRTRPGANATKFTVPKQKKGKTEESESRVPKQKKRRTEETPVCESCTA